MKARDSNYVFGYVSETAGAVSKTVTLPLRRTPCISINVTNPCLIANSNSSACGFYLWILLL